MGRTKVKGQIKDYSRRGFKIFWGVQTDPVTLGIWTELSEQAI